MNSLNVFGTHFSVTSISLTFLIGLADGKVMTINKKTSICISTETTICGDSAIADISTYRKLGLKKEIHIYLHLILDK